MTNPSTTTDRPALSRTEFIALIAMLVATIAFSIDAMLPALPEIGAELSPANPNRAQLILTSFVFGMGLGTFFTGPLSDRFGRKPVILAGSALYMASAALAWVAGSLELVLLARFFQGLGAAGPRVVATAIVRDLYAGRGMAEIMSFIMLVFSIVPAIAPTLGAEIIAFTGWRGVFGAFMLFSLISTTWFMLRQPETLAPGQRRPFTLAAIWQATCELFSVQMVRLSILVQTLCMAMLFSVLSSAQQVYDEIFGLGHSFHYWFGLTAVIAASASFINARVVVRLGMRLLITVALAGQILASAVMLILAATGALPETAFFWCWFAWMTSVFFMVGLTLGNLNALAMEPFSHIAGLAASIIAAVPTVLSMLIAVPIGLAFNGTVTPLVSGVLACAIVGYILIRRMARLERVRS